MGEVRTRALRATARGVPGEVAHLIIIRAPGTDLQSLPGRAYRLHNTHEIKVGRAADNDIVLGDDSVSRRHCVVFHDEHGWTIRNLSQTNQTGVVVLVAGQSTGANTVSYRPIAEAKLGKLDMVVVGEYKLTFYSGPWSEPEFVKYLKGCGIEQLTDGVKIINL